MGLCSFSCGPHLDLAECAPGDLSVLTAPGTLGDEVSPSFPCWVCKTFCSVESSLSISGAEGGTRSWTWFLWPFLIGLEAEDAGRMGPLLPSSKSFDFRTPLTQVLLGLAIKTFQPWAALGVLRLDAPKIPKPFYSFLCLLDSEEILHWNPCCKAFQYLCRRWVYNGMFSPFLALGNGSQRESSQLSSGTLGEIFLGTKTPENSICWLSACIKKKERNLIWSIFRVGFHLGQTGSDISSFIYKIWGGQLMVFTFPTLAPAQISSLLCLG